MKMLGQCLLQQMDRVDELTNLARQAERELLAKGISKINFTGLPKQEIAIQVEPTTIHDLGLSLQKIAGLINNQSQDVMAGTAGSHGWFKNNCVRSAKCQMSVVFEQLPLLTGDNAQLLRLGDVADISLRPKEDQSTIQYEGKPAIQLVIMRSKNDDTIKTAAIMNKWVVDAPQALPPKCRINRL